MRKLTLILLLPILLSAKVPIIDKTITITKRYEGYAKHLYWDMNGYSIGYGTNLAQGINKEEAELLLRYRLKTMYKSLSKFGWFRELNDTRKTAVLDLAYNIGIPKLMKFKVFIWRLKHGYYHGAANSLKHSLWYTQVGNRAKHIYNLIYKG